jgi:transposase
MTPTFKAEAVRIVLTSGRTVGQVADDLGIGHSTLSKWVSAHKEADLLPRKFFGPHADVSKELARLRKENEILRQERDLLNRHGK